MHIECWTRPCALGYRVAWLARKFGASHLVLQVILLVKRKRLPTLQFILGGIDDVIIESRNQNAAVLILQLGNDLSQGDERIRRRSTIHPGMKIDLCSPS